MPTKTLQPIQITLMGNKWSDFSDDDEYNMKKYGVSDPNDIPKISKKNPDGTTVEISQNQRNAEIKASADLDNLKKIYSKDVASFSDIKKDTEENKQYFEDKENERQAQLNQDYYQVGALES